MEDRMLLKRMNSSNMNRDKGTKRLVLSKEMLQSRMSLLEEEGADDVLKLVNSTEVPDWMLPILKKLPDEGVEKARNSMVEKIVAILSKAKIPSQNHILLKCYVSFEQTVYLSAYLPLPRIPINSTSNIKVAPGGMRSPAPRFPYANPAGITSRLFSLDSQKTTNDYSTHIPHSPFSQPFITRPAPSVTGKIR